MIRKKVILEINLKGGIKMTLSVMQWLNKYRYILIIYILVVAYLLTWIPKEFIYSFTGVKYRLNSDVLMEEATISFDGTIIKPLLGGRTYRGTITVNDIEYNIVELEFDKFNSAHIVYFEDYGAIRSFGTIFFDKSFESFTIKIFEKKGGNASGWSSEDGLMITAPATNREKAIELANYHVQKMIIE